MKKKDLDNYYKYIIEYIQDAFWTLKPDIYNFSFVSDAFCALLGFNIGELMSKSLDDILSNESYIKFSNSLKKRIEEYEQGNLSGYIQVISVDHVGKNGEIIPSEIINFLLPDKVGKVAGILCISSNLSTRNKIQNQLQWKDQEIEQLKRAYQILRDEHISLIEELKDRNHHILEYNYELTKSVKENLMILSKLNEAQSNANIGSWEWNIQTGEIWWSEQLYHIFEVNSNEYIPSPEDNIKFVHPDDKELYYAVSSKYINSGELLNCDFRIITHKGNTKYCNATGKVSYDTNGQPTHFTGTLMDITHRKTADESLKKMYHALKYIISETSQKTGIEYFNSMVVALCKIMDADYSHIGILQPDRQTIKTIALSNKQQILPGIEYKLHGTPCETVVNKLTSCYQKDVTILFPNEKLLKDMNVEGYIGVPIYFKSGEPLGLIVCLYTKPIEDSLFSETIIKIFTDRAVNEYERFKEKEQLELALEKAEESDRLKSMFLQNMSHEIRTPMNAIIGFAELLSHNFNNKEKLSQFSQIIQKRSKDLLDLINDILDLSRIESGKQSLNLEIYDLNKLFYELDEMFQVYKKKKNKNAIKLTFHYIDPLKSIVITDVGKLRQILVNLINNAIKFTEKGKIDVGCSIGLETELNFYVEDTGKGIPLDKQNLIFNRFIQVNDAYGSQGGTGLGLAIVKGLVELLEGQIWLESKEGEGSRFTFSIKYQSAMGLEDSAISSGEPDLSLFLDKKLLLVEDDIYSVIYMKELLSGSGFIVHHEISGRSAINYVQNHQVDIVLLDIRLPEIDGYEVAQRLKIQYPNIRIIAQTAYAMQEDRRKAIAAGCDDYISKPVEKMQLLRIIQSQLSH